MLGLRQEDWGPVDPLNLGRQLFYADPSQNHSWQEPGHLITARVPFDIPLSGMADRYGVPVAAGCTVGPDCVPYDFGTLRGGQSYQFRMEAVTATVREYDVKDSTGKSLIRFPN